RSLQIAACPGIFREVETAYQTILHNLQIDPDLKQTDIAIMATDPAEYRPVIPAGFDRQPGLISYSLPHQSAADFGSYGHAALGLLDLALDTISRSRLLAVLMNPCFLASQGLNRTQVDNWFRWVEKLGIYPGREVNDQKEAIDWQLVGTP